MPTASFDLEAVSAATHHHLATRSWPGNDGVWPRNGETRCDTVSTPGNDDEENNSGHHAHRCPGEIFLEKEKGKKVLLLRFCSCTQYLL
jgi:hypothetical protein